MFASNRIIGMALAAAAPLLMLIGPTRPVAAADRDDFPVIGVLLNQLRFASDNDDREKAAKELGKLGDPRALPALQQAAVYDKKDDVRDEARKSILKIFGKEPPRDAIVLTTDIVGRLTRTLFDAKDDDDREKAAKELGRLGDPRALAALEIATVFDKEDDVRDAARKAAVEIRQGLGPVREELNYRVYTPDQAPAPQFQPQPAPYTPPPAPQPQYELPAPPPPPQPQGNLNEQPYFNPQADSGRDGWSSGDQYANNGTVNAGNTTINKTYAYTYNNTYNYNSNNTTANPPATSYQPLPNTYVPQASYPPPVSYTPTPVYTPPAIYCPAPIYTQPTVCPPPQVILPPRTAVSAQVEIRRHVVVRQPIAVHRPIVTPQRGLNIGAGVQIGRGMSFSFDFSKVSDGRRGGNWDGRRH